MGNRTTHRTGRAERWRIAATALVLAALPLTGCSAEPELLLRGTTEVTLDEGETVQVALGQWSSSIGDKWGVVSQTDETVAEAGVVSGESVTGARPPENPPEVGGDAPHAIEITGLAPGTTTVRVLYCYRSSIEEGCDQGPGDRSIDPVEVTVTVR